MLTFGDGFPGGARSRRPPSAPSAPSAVLSPDSHDRGGIHRRMRGKDQHRFSVCLTEEDNYQPTSFTGVEHRADTTTTAMATIDTSGSVLWQPIARSCDDSVGEASPRQQHGLQHQQATSTVNAAGAVTRLKRGRADKQTKRPTTIANSPAG